jgi:hypothetical protein
MALAHWTHTECNYTEFFRSSVEVSSVARVIWYFCNRPTWAIMNIKVKGITPNVLNAIQKSREKLRHTASLRQASATKKHAHRTVSLRQP